MNNDNLYFIFVVIVVAFTLLLIVSNAFWFNAYEDILNSKCTCTQQQTGK